MKKYKLTNETKEFCGRTLHRIQALKTFANVNEGDLGGWVEKEGNLSQGGKCWIFDDAMVYNNARVTDDAKLFDNAIVKDDAWISDRVWVSDNAIVGDKAQIKHDAEIYEHASVSGNAIVENNVRILGRARVYDNVRIKDDAWISDRAVIEDVVCVGEKAQIKGNARIKDNAQILGDAVVKDNARIFGDAVIKSSEDYIVFKNWWSSGRFFTWTRSNNMWEVGCFYGTGEELIKKAYKDSDKSGREYERVVNYVKSILADEENEKKD